MNLQSKSNKLDVILIQQSNPTITLECEIKNNGTEIIIKMQKDLEFSRDIISC